MKKLLASMVTLAVSVSMFVTPVFAAFGDLKIEGNGKEAVVYIEEYSENQPPKMIKSFKTTGYIREEKDDVYGTVLILEKGATVELLDAEGWMIGDEDKFAFTENGKNLYEIMDKDPNSYEDSKHKKITFIGRDNDKATRVTFSVGDNADVYFKVSSSQASTQTKPQPAAQETQQQPQQPVALSHPPAVNDSSQKFMTTGNVNVRTAPNTRSAIIGVASKGDGVQVIEKVGNWYKVNYVGKTAYIHNSFIKESAPVDTSRSTTKTVNVGVVNVRSGAGKQFKAIGVVKKGQTVSVIGNQGGWAKISYNSVVGYVDGDFLK